jgi:hypothetical protein
MIELLAGPYGPLVIFSLRFVDVSLGTMRFLLVTRGQRAPAALIGFVESLIWITAAGAAIQNLSSPLHLVGYAGGFSPSVPRRSRHFVGKVTPMSSERFARWVSA